MTNKVTVGLLPITKQIVVGKVNTKGMWVGNRTDVTNDAIISVGDFLLATKQSMSFQGLDGKQYEILIKEIVK